MRQELWITFEQNDDVFIGLLILLANGQVRQTLLRWLPPLPVIQF
ncbi:MAG: hypothetical protein WDN28_26535 [Chthoniobacter sp.]